MPPPFWGKAPDALKYIFGDASRKNKELPLNVRMHGNEGYSTVPRGY
jgi:hypothetical protein